MNQKQIQYFVEVYRKKSVQAAADALYISRQGVSRTIRMLEEELGQPLFQRTANGLIPTDYAAALMPHAQRLLLEYETIFGMNTLAAQSQSVVTVYALDHLAAYLGSDFILRFHEQYPHIILSLVDTSDTLASEALAAQNCSFAMITGPVDESRFQADPLFYSCYSIRMHRDHPLAQKEILTYDILQIRPLSAKDGPIPASGMRLTGIFCFPVKRLRFWLKPPMSRSLPNCCCRTVRSILDTTMLIILISALKS